MRKDSYTPTTLTASVIIRVRFSETDPLGIVWHGNYIKYFEEGREAFGRKYGLSYLDVQREGYATPIVKSLCEHKKMVQYGEQLRVETHYMLTSVAKLVFQYFLYNEADELVCTGETVQVFTSLVDNSLALYPPPFYEKWKNKMKELF